MSNKSKDKTTIVQKGKSSIKNFGKQFKNQDGEYVPQKIRWLKILITLLILGAVGTGLWAAWAYGIGGKIYKELRGVVRTAYVEIFIDRNLDFCTQNEGDLLPGLPDNGYQSCLYTVQNLISKDYSYSNNYVIEVADKISRNNYWIAVTDLNWNQEEANDEGVYWASVAFHTVKTDGNHKILDITDVFKE